MHSKPSTIDASALPNRSGKTFSLVDLWRGPTGDIRAGWRLLLFLLIYGGLMTGTQFALSALPAFRAWIASLPHGITTPTSLLAYQGTQLAVLIVATFLIARIERRTFADYSLPSPTRHLRQIGLGIALGLGMAGTLIGLLAVFGGYSVQIAKPISPSVYLYAAEYVVGYLVVGLFEEFSFRGYLQTTLAAGIGFWPAAIVLSIGFGAMHLQNGIESILPAVIAGCFGLVAALALRRTGSLWMIIGLHAAFDWSVSFLAAAPLSGYVLEGRPWIGVLHGPAWLTGGAAGPRGSVLLLLVLAAIALAIWKFVPQHRYAPLATGETSG